MFQDLLFELSSSADLDFVEATAKIARYIDSTHDFINIIEEIGTIPESIVHDSTEEKLFSKASDAVLARAFREIGLKSTVIRERADSADVIAESPIHGYTLVADAKAFRMSRTAKNQKDFKVVALSGWRKDADYAVLCSPYYHYPKTQSQIYAQSIDDNVCLLSWEHLIFMIKNAVTENSHRSFADIWNFGEFHSHNVISANRKRCFLIELSQLFAKTIGADDNGFNKLLIAQIARLKSRGEEEITFWKNEIKSIQSYTKEQAIDELIKAKKINSKIEQIDQFVRGLRK